MKTAYGSAFILCVCILVLGSVASVAMPQSELIAYRLRRHPDLWRLEVKSQDAFPESSEEAGRLLVAFLEQNPRPSSASAEHFFHLVAVAAAFSGIGWIRETLAGRKKRRTDKALCEERERAETSATDNPGKS